MKDIVFITQAMCGGGAERVISLLTTAFSAKGYNITLIITGQKQEEAILETVSPDVKVIFVPAQEKNKDEFISLFTRLKGKLNAEQSLIDRFSYRNTDKIDFICDYLNALANATVISFLNEPIFISLLLRKHCKKLIISERNDPSKFVGTKTTMAFIHKLYQKADVMVCQSPDAEKWYKENSSVKTTVIFNPIKADLPEPFNGERQKKIVNFCRISSQKNLVMLIDAFAELSHDYPEYQLYIYGDAAGNGAEGYLDEVKAEIEKLNLKDRVFIHPARADIHSVINDYAMFVSSSDFEGMSNSMLEAMAMGMPVVCTDCPAGGARAVIKDHENGLLVPVGDADAMYRGMKELIETPALADTLGKNAAKIRETQSVENIINQWLELIND